MDSTRKSNPQLWCNLCQRQFRTTSALYQHGKRLSHLKRAMKISSSRCTTITNGKITSSIQRKNFFTSPISIVQVPPPSSPSIVVDDDDSQNKQNPILVRKIQHEINKSIQFSYTCDLCSCRCWSIRNIRRHVRLHADVRPFICQLCQLNFKSYSNLMKHFKTSRHQQQSQIDGKCWTIDSKALQEQNNLIDQLQIIDGESTNENNLLEDLHIPDSRLIDGDVDEWALIDQNTFDELHKAAECLLNLQGVFYFGEDETNSTKAS